MSMNWLKMLVGGGKAGPNALPPSRLQRLDAVRAAAQSTPAETISRPVPPPRMPGLSLASAQLQSIVFRQLYPPPPAGTGFSFFGGTPIGPASLAWPRAEGKALHFIMQWDCRDLAPCDAAGLLPREGGLFLFCDLEWGDPMGFRFIHMAGSPEDWTELPAPDDLGPVLGSEGLWKTPWLSPDMPQDAALVPRLLPRWPFTPLVIDYPQAAGQEEAERPHIYWNDRSGVAMQLVAAQNSLGAPLSAFNPKQPTSFDRPFPSFPHDWAALRILCVGLIDKLAHPGSWTRWAFPDEMDAEARAVLIAQWQSEARGFHEDAGQHDMGDAVPQTHADTFWHWYAALPEGLRLGLRRQVEQSVDASLGMGSRGAESVPPGIIAATSLLHSLGHAYQRDEYQHEFLKRHAHLPPSEAGPLYEELAREGGLPRIDEVFAPTPAHMFGPPSYVQGVIEERLDEGWLLLLELPGNEAIGHALGEGVLQFIIRPEDLRAGCWDRVELIISAY